MANSMEPCKMLWADPCCHGNEIWARHEDPVAYRLAFFMNSLMSVCIQVEIPPTYEDTFEPSESDLDSSGHWFSQTVPSHGPRRTGVTPSDRSGSLQHSRPPRVRSRRHYSDGTDPHRRRRYVRWHCLDATVCT